MIDNAKLQHAKQITNGFQVHFQNHINENSSSTTTFIKLFKTLKEDLYPMIIICHMDVLKVFLINDNLMKREHWGVGGANVYYLVMIIKIIKKYNHHSCCY